MANIFKYLFYAYVILLAGYVTYNSVMKRSFGNFHIIYEKPDRQCEKGGRDWEYCIYRAKNSRSDVYLYALHGKDSDAHFWFRDYGHSALLQEYWQNHNNVVPTVITISFGPVWLLTERGTPENSGLLERFKKEVFPIIEEKHGAPRGRFLLGSSMGGLNALSLSLYMPEHFSRIAAICPPLTHLSPFAAWREVVNFSVRTGAEPRAVFTFLGLGRHFFADQYEWNQFSPLKKMRNVRFTTKPHYYISAGLRDRFGLYEGARDMARALKKAGAQTHWKPHSGGHCAVDIESLGRFLSLQ